MTPLGAVVRGAVAGAVGTLALDAVNYVEYKAQGGTDSPRAWEFSAGLDSWEDAPAPAQIGRRVVEGVFQIELPPTRARLVNNVMHWIYGVAWGAQYGVVAASVKRRPRPRGPLFGTVVWLSGYVVLPLAKLYKPIWEYDGQALAKDWAPHLAYGTTTVKVFDLISGSAS